MRNAAGVGLGGFRAVLSFFIHVGVASILVASPFVVDNWYSQKHAPRYEPVVEIHDEANALDVDDLEADLKEVRFRKKTHLAVLTVPGQNVVNLNAEVLKYAETQMAGSPWISKDNPNYWRDGLLILAVAPDGRKVGCYVGEDLKISQESQADIQDSAKDHFRAKDWNGGVKSMAERSADLIANGNTPQRTVFLLTLLGVGGVATVWLIWYVWSGPNTSKKYMIARRTFSRVVYGYEETISRAALVPDDNTHGALILSRCRWFDSEYTEVSRMWNELPEPYGFQWYVGATRRSVNDLKERSEALQLFETIVSHAAILFSRASDWPAVWDNECGPVMEDIQALVHLCREAQRSKVAVDGDEEREWAALCLQHLRRLPACLREGSVTPSQALSELDKISDGVRVRVDNLMAKIVEIDGSRGSSRRRRRYEKMKSEPPANTMSRYEGKWEIAGSKGEYDPRTTIRVNPGTPDVAVLMGVDGGAVDVTDGVVRHQFSSSGGPICHTPVSSLIVGYSAAIPSDISAGSGSGGSSSSGGYDGGGFSGTGSSSSF